MLTAINPATGEPLKNYKETTFEEARRRLEKSQEAFQSWRQTRFSARAAVMRAASRILIENQSEYARTMALEMGKPIKFGREEIEKCAWVCEYYAENAEKMLQNEIIQTDARKSYVTYNPTGIILAIMPWNYPFWQVFRHAAPGLMGNPLDEAVEIGPQARTDLREDLHRQITHSIEKGAICLLGGEIPSGAGSFYPATVLSKVAKGMPAYDEETFGPVAAIVAVKNERQAIQVANDSAFGLGAAIFTRDVERGERIAVNDLEAGNCFVNAFVKSDPRLPFGGIKQSGYGRELSHYGLKEFVNIKTVYVQ